MRPGRGCKSCRQRHAKCVTEEGASSCRKCIQAGRTCDFEPRIRFVPVSHVDAASKGAGARVELTFDSDQVWVSTRKPVKFIVEDGVNGLDTIVDNTPQDDISRNASSLAVAQDDRLAENTPTILGPELSSISRQQNDETSQPSNDPDFTQPSPERSEYCHADAATNPTPSPTLPMSIATEDRLELGASVLGSGTGMSRGISLLSNATFNALPRTTLSSRREAYLLHNYINNLAPWADVCDSAHHFRIYVPQICLRIPMMLYAILASSARHQSIMAKTDEMEAAYYHGKSLELLIDALSAPEETYDENLLATVVILRQYEEMGNDQDSRTHLLGTSRLLNAISRLAISEGLGQAAAWWSLRQAVYVSLVQKQPMDICLGNYDQSSVFDLQDDAAYANIIILLVARILHLLHSPHSTANLTAWEVLETEVDAWDRSKPETFLPVYYEGCEPSQDRPFPSVSLLSSTQAVALQYYHAAKILFKLHKPIYPVLLGFDAARSRSEAERVVTHHLVMVVGLSTSNTHMENVMFEAHHILSMCGYCLKHPAQREGAIKFLKWHEDVCGWRTSATIEMLEKQWKHLDAPGD